MIPVIHLFPKIDAKLIELLQSLTANDWEKQSIAPLWTVKDIAAHLLDGNIRAISMLRDHYFGVKPEAIHNYRDLVQYLNNLNADWVHALKRVSPKMLIDLLEHTGKSYVALLEALDPNAPAMFAVAWAGEDTSANWFHIAREYTEKWHHQQQIRLAVGKTEALYSKEFYFPYLDTSMRALPHHYQGVKGEKQESIQFSIITADETYHWFLQSDGQKWVLKETVANEPSSVVQINGDIAWRIFTKGIAREEALKEIDISGKTEIGIKIVDMLAIMAL